MTPLEWIGLVQLLVIPLFGFAWRTWGHNVKNEKVRNAIGIFVRGAEEISASRGLPDGQSKEDFVLRKRGSEGTAGIWQIYRR